MSTDLTSAKHSEVSATETKPLPWSAISPYLIYLPCLIKAHIITIIPRLASKALALGQCFAAAKSKGATSVLAENKNFSLQTSAAAAAPPPIRTGWEGCPRKRRCYLGEVWVGVEAALVADFAVTLGAGIEVRLAGGGGELCRLAYGAERAAGEGGDLRERVGRGRGAAPVR